MPPASGLASIVDVRQGRGEEDGGEWFQSETTMEVTG